MEPRNAMLEAQAAKYGITYDEAVQRQRYWFGRVGTAEDNPDNPICIGCMKHPVDLPEYLELAADSEDDYIRITGLPDDERRKIAVRSVQREEGTYNRENGHFLCNACYIIEGMPTSDRGWVTP